jgi:hypothetical protein
MQRGDYDELVKSLHKQRTALSSKKGTDYADHDILSNFKRMAEISNILRIRSNTPFGYAMFMALLKIDRIMNICTKQSKPTNESLDDSFMDLHNYIDLARAILFEEENIGVPKYKSKYTEDTGPGL